MGAGPSQLSFMPIDPLDLTITSALAAIQRGDVSPGELLALCRRQIERYEPLINAFITLMEPPSDWELLTPGAIPVPVAVKDLIDVAVVPTTAGSPQFFGKEPAERDAFIVERLRAAGAAIIGKTNTHEIALGVTGVNPHFGAVHNPHNLEHITGGSSSGSAAAVAAGMAFAALGTDTGGSVRIPASLCGVVGLKPTRGRMSVRGILPLSLNLDHAGILTRSVPDAALLLKHLAGYDPLDPASVDIPVEDYTASLDPGIAGWHVALGTGHYIEASDPAVLQALENAAEILASLGADVERVDLDWLEPLAQANSRMTQADAWAFHQDRLEKHPEWFGEDVRQRLESGGAIGLGGYITARKTQSEGKRRMEILLQDFDVLVLPTTPIPAPRIQGTQALEAARNLTRFTSPFNLTGMPALSIPCGLISGQLPLGLQLIARPWGESRLFAAGNRLEEALQFRQAPAGLVRI